MGLTNQFYTNVKLKLMTLLMELQDMLVYQISRGRIKCVMEEI